MLKLNLDSCYQNRNIYFYISVPVNKKPEIQILVPVPANPEPEIGFQFVLSPIFLWQICNYHLNIGLTHNTSELIANVHSKVCALLVSIGHPWVFFVVVDIVLFWYISVICYISVIFEMTSIWENIFHLGHITNVGHIHLVHIAHLGNTWLSQYVGQH